MKILVLLGTQKQRFDRLIDKIKKIDLTKYKITVQTGDNNYDLNPQINVFSFHDDINDLIKTSDIIITHGGVGTIMESLKLNKKVIVMAREKAYGEHINDHQGEIVNKFANLNYIMCINDNNDINDMLNLVKSYNFTKYPFNNQKLIMDIQKKIDV